jgi:hypothetical protein
MPPGAVGASKRVQFPSDWDSLSGACPAEGEAIAGEESKTKRRKVNDIFLTIRTPIFLSLYSHYRSIFFNISLI